MVLANGSLSVWLKLAWADRTFQLTYVTRGFPFLGLVERFRLPICRLIPWRLRPGLLTWRIKTFSSCQAPLQSIGRRISGRAEFGSVGERPTLRRVRRILKNVIDWQLDSPTWSHRITPAFSGRDGVQDWLCPTKKQAERNSRAATRLLPSGAGIGQRESRRSSDVFSIRHVAPPRIRPSAPNQSRTPRPLPTLRRGQRRHRLSPTQPINRDESILVISAVSPPQDNQRHAHPELLRRGRHF